MARRNAVVLVVDDDPQIRSVFSDYLDDLFEVRTAESGPAALEEVDDDVDVVLLDRRMPGMSGRQLLSKLRREGYSQPVAMVTAVEPDFDLLDMGFDDYVVKPVFEEELRDVVETMVLRKEYDDVIREYFALVSKVTALKMEMDGHELDGHAGFEESKSRLEEIKREARNGIEVAIDSGKFDQIFADHLNGDADLDFESANEEANVPKS
jgi:DNA-binding response OmpR family regulator